MTPGGATFIFKMASKILFCLYLRDMTNVAIRHIEKYFKIHKKYNFWGAWIMRKKYFGRFSKILRSKCAISISLSTQHLWPSLLQSINHNSLMKINFIVHNTVQKTLHMLWNILCKLKYVHCILHALQNFPHAFKIFCTPLVQNISWRVIIVRSTWPFKWQQEPFQLNKINSIFLLCSPGITEEYRRSYRKLNSQ